MATKSTYVDGTSTTIASATTIDPFAEAADTVFVTGTTLITGITSTANIGAKRTLIFSGAATLQCVSPVLTIPGVTNLSTIQMEAGAKLELQCVASGQFVGSYELGGSTSLTGQGFSSATTFSVNYNVRNGVVTLKVTSQTTNTSNATNFYATGLPASCQPAYSGGFTNEVIAYNSGAAVRAVGTVGTSYPATDIYFDIDTSTASFNQNGWTASGTKGLAIQTITYSLF